MLADEGKTEDPLAVFSLFALLREEWREQANCRDIVVDGRHLTSAERLALFFPERGNRSHGVAKATCAACPVRVECDDFRRRSHSEYGIWGGKIAKRTTGTRRGTEDAISE